MENKTTVFLIDDDTDDQEIFCLAMKQANEEANCVFADDGLAAIEKIKADENFIPDYIFIDINMPRMNGQQCLAEIKKIERLKNVPIFMYSTSANSSSIAENKKLGATDFIIKPSSINDLSKILTKIITKKIKRIMLLVFCLSIVAEKALAQNDTLAHVKELKKLSVEELMDIVVTSVSKTPQKLSEVASAIQVITGEDVKRSTVTRLPEALRLAGNLQVAQSGSHDWGITSRGFKGTPIASSSLADKLLVTIDGRTVYTPLFAGVYWDVQNVLLEDLDRIEVISGPGGSLWGANAVNGIVNIISKSAKETQGVYASASVGTFLRDYAGLRYGYHKDTTLYFRVYGQRYDYNNTLLHDGSDALDAWDMTQAGFRTDFIPSSKNNFTLQGDAYVGTEDDTASTFVNGQNAIGRWTHSFSNKSALIIQTYFDRTHRNTSRQNLSDELVTYDIDAQHNLHLGKRNHLVWGIGYRMAQNEIHIDLNTITPSTKTLQLYNAFIQDQLAIIPERLELTLGTKLSHNDYTEYELQPTIRLAWMPNSVHTLWTAVSRAVRTPSRLDADYSSATLSSVANFKSEKVLAYELGYRLHPTERMLFSFATYYNQYTDLRSIDTNQTAPPVLLFANNTEANTYGLEVSANVIFTKWWRIRACYSYLHESFTYNSPYTYPHSNLFEALDPVNQYFLQSIIDITKNFQFDGLLRYVDVLSASLNGSYVPAYTTLDLRIAWQYKWFTVSVFGQNLASSQHAEFGTREIPRRVMGKITVSF